ncbi:MAG: alpha/beta hydrolase [Nocardioides sp.]|uniref:alpha/beta hydrolase n=1 Tax=Nocardioides sp. TaxID=35761 RepID=UPI0039E6093D
MSWETDVLGAPYAVEAFALKPDVEGAVEANLVRLESGEGGSSRAVLHVHGFCDYFFQTEYAQWWADRGYDFYALDLRKYGRSLRDHQTPGYVDDLSEYFEELDLAWQMITERDGHDSVLLSAHSTGGLTVPLWARERAVPFRAMVLNSPWVDMHGPFLMRLGAQVVRRVGAYQPRREIPRNRSTIYAQGLHASMSGEWDYDLAWKPPESWPVYAGWVRAIKRGQATLSEGLDLRSPALVLTSARTGRPNDLTDEVWSTDIVLDVTRMRRCAPALGRHVTVVAVDGAMHDVVLSRAPARSRVYDEIDRWLRAYVEVDPGGR